MAEEVSGELEGVSETETSAAAKAAAKLAAAANSQPPTSGVPHWLLTKISAAESASERPHHQQQQPQGSVPAQASHDSHEGKPHDDASPRQDNGRVKDQKDQRSNVSPTPGTSPKPNAEGESEVVHAKPPAGGVAQAKHQNAMVEDQGSGVGSATSPLEVATNSTGGTETGTRGKVVERDGSGVTSSGIAKHLGSAIPPARALEKTPDDNKVPSIVVDGVTGSDGNGDGAKSSSGETSTCTTPAGATASNGASSIRPSAVDPSPTTTSVGSTEVSQGVVPTATVVPVVPAVAAQTKAILLVDGTSLGTSLALSAAVASSVSAGGAGTVNVHPPVQQKPPFAEVISEKHATASGVESARVPDSGTGSQVASGTQTPTSKAPASGGMDMKEGKESTRSRASDEGGIMAPVAAAAAAVAAVKAAVAGAAIGSAGMGGGSKSGRGLPGAVDLLVYLMRFRREIYWKGTHWNNRWDSC